MKTNPSKKTNLRSNAKRSSRSAKDFDHAAYKAGVKAKLYRNYFTNLHASEQKVDTSATMIVNREILHTFRSAGKQHLLDAGCGDGLFIASALSEGMDCEGMDTNKDLLAVCTKKGYRVKQGDLSSRLPYPDNTFEGVFCSNVFEHLPEPEFTLYELLRILKDDGLLIITVPEAGDRIFYNDWTHITPFTKQTLRNLVSCVQVKDYKTYRRHFPVLVAQWKNPLVRWGNRMIRQGFLAAIFTKLYEKTGYVHRHDLILEIRK